MRISLRWRARGAVVLVSSELLELLGMSDRVLERTLLDAMIDTAQRQVLATAALQSKKGCAAWVQERSIGHADPGATAWLRFLQAWRG